MMTAPLVYYESAFHRLCAWENVGVSLLCRPIEWPDFERLTTLIEELHQAHGAPPGLLCWLLPGFDISDIHRRKEVLRLLRLYKNKLGAFGFVLEAQSDVSRVQRKIVHTYKTLSEGAVPTGTFPNVTEAARWLTQTLAPLPGRSGYSPEQLKAALRLCCRARLRGASQHPQLAIQATPMPIASRAGVEMQQAAS